MTAKTILKNTFGYDEFRPLQEQIIATILNKQDSLIVMPTGGGKSLCYQIPALIFNGLTIVISPLISLMKDQVEQLTELGVNAVVLNSSISSDDYRYNSEQVRTGKAKLLYVAPETLSLEKTLDLLKEAQVDCLTVDEAHCISEWGHDFRPDYRQIAHIKKMFKSSVTVAFTATATPLVQSDIIKSLKLNNAKKYVASFNRNNLFLQILHKSDPFAQTVKFLRNYPNQSGIIYCFSRKQVDELYEDLKNLNFSVLPYHAGLTDEDRRKNQEEFIKDDVQIIVATIAFGMGINKPNVRFVIHYDLPKNIESYYQEIGRAGRDGLRAHCLLLFGYGDINKINYFIDQKEEKERRIAKQHLNSLVSYAESFNCRRTPLLNYFGENYSSSNCEMCDNCLKETKGLVDVTIEAQKFLSCVKRTGEIFGTNHIIDVLRGSKAQKVVNNNHHNLTTYNIGKDLSKDQWQNLSRQFIQNNLLTKDLEFGSLKITDEGKKLLRGELKVKGKIIEDTMLISSDNISDLDYDKKLFEMLRAKRKTIADRIKVPPYVIFPDKTLIGMAALLPKTEKDFRRVHGVGEMKLKRYANQFLPIIIEFCNSKSYQKESQKPQNIVYKKSKHEKVGELYQETNDLNKLVNQLNVKQNTVIGHLIKFVQEGNKINTKPLLKLLTITEIKKNEIYDAFDKLGSNYLKPVYDEMNETISYDELRIVQICYISEKNND